MAYQLLDHLHSVEKAQVYVGERVVVVDNVKSLFVLGDRNTVWPSDNLIVQYANQSCAIWNLLDKHLRYHPIREHYGSANKRGP